jgi:CspA family cold shock protein
MSSGKVKFYKEDKGYGFILDSKTGKDVFVHATGLTEEIRKDDEVEFEIEEGKKGPNAVKVRRASVDA